MDNITFTLLIKILLNVVLIAITIDIVSFGSILISNVNVMLSIINPGFVASNLSLDFYSTLPPPNNSLNITSKTCTTILLPACLYSCAFEFT